MFIDAKGHVCFSSMETPATVEDIPFLQRLTWTFDFLNWKNCSTNMFPGTKNYAEIRHFTQYKFHSNPIFFHHLKMLCLHLLTSIVYILL